MLHHDLPQCLQRRSDGLGPFNRLALTWRVFGKDPVDRSIQQITDVLGRWGYRIGRGEDQRLPTVLCQAFLLNRSPLLEDLTSDAFARLRTDSAWARWHTGSLHGIQRAVASLGHCDPPPLSKHGSMPAIEGAAETWAAWVER